jgi:hypothetical protein
VVQSRQPFIINECARGTGAACGAEYLNAGFEQLVRRKMGSLASEILNPRRTAEILRNFETVIKYQFNPLSSECDAEFEIPIPGASDVPSIGLEAGYLKLKRYISIRLC